MRNLHERTLLDNLDALVLQTDRDNDQKPAPAVLVHLDPGDLLVLGVRSW